SASPWRSRATTEPVFSAGACRHYDARQARRRHAPGKEDAILDELSSRPISAVLESLGATAAGLNRAEVEVRRRQHGLNQPRAQRRRPRWVQFLSRFLSPLVLILLFASALSAATGNVTSFVIVIVMVVLSVTLD